MQAAGWSALEQSWAYGDAVAATRGAKVHRGLVRDENGTCQAVVQAVEKPLGKLLRLVRIVRGPLLPNGAAAPAPLYATIRAAFRRKRRSFLFWLPELHVSDRNHELMRACGARRVVTGYSTVRVDLRKTSESLRGEMHGTWRNALRAAERGSLRIRVTRGGAALDRLLLEYDRLQRRNRFSGHPSALLKAITENRAGGGRDVTVVSAQQGSDTVAAGLFLRHGQTATYTAAWASDDGRAANAPRLVLWHGITNLRDQGLAWLDLGGVNTSRAPGLARFKLGLGGEVVTLAGTYF